MSKARFFALLSITVAAAAARLIPHPPNFTPIGAMALFGGAFLQDKRAAFAVPLVAMFLSDLLLGYGMHALVPFVYGSFALIVCLGLLIRHRRSPFTIGGAALAGSVLFFVLTNFGVWLVGDLYPRTVEGLITCFVAGIPFFGNTLAGDAFYAATLFGGFAFAQRYFPALREQPSAGEVSS
jgi:hypothetical protein